MKETELAASFKAAMRAVQEAASVMGCTVEGVMEAFKKAASVIVTDDLVSKIKLLNDIRNRPRKWFNNF